MKRIVLDMAIVYCVKYLLQLETSVHCSCESCQQHCCDVLASAAGGAPPLSLSSHVRVHQTWIQHDPHVLSSQPSAIPS